MAYSWEQLFERSGDLRPSKRFWDQKYFLGVAGTEARVSLLRRVTDDDDGKFGVIRVITHGVEERLAHIVDGTIEHESISALLRATPTYGRWLGQEETSCRGRAGGLVVTSPHCLIAPRVIISSATIRVMLAGAEWLA